MTEVGYDHNFLHVQRVRNLAMQIAESEKDVDGEILEISCYLHDVGYDREMTDKVDHAVVGSELASEFLRRTGYDSAIVEAVKHCILAHRYRSDYQPQSIEAKILFDADKLDGSGAIGIVRGSMWLGKHGANPLADYYDGYVTDNQGGKVEGRIKDKSRHSLLIDYEVKGRHLPEKMFTAAGKEIAKTRVAFYKSVLDRLKLEESGRA